MRNWRVLTAIVAVVLAGGAAVLAYSYLTQADERAQKDVALVGVLVAGSEIARGTTGDEAIESDLLETEKVPRNVVPDDYLQSPEGLRGLVAAGPIGRGQFILRGTFVAPSQIEGFSSTIRSAKQAISVAVDATHGVAGFVVPSDTVNIIVTTDIEDPTAPEGKNIPLTTTAFLVPGLKVLAVDQTTVNSQLVPEGQSTGENAAPLAAGLLTLEVTPRQALQIAHAVQGGGQIYVSLNAPKFDPNDFVIPAEIVEAANWFDQDLSTYNTLRTQINTAP